MSNETVRFCDWRTEIYDCVMSDIFKSEAILSLITYGILAITGTFIFIYRYKYMKKGIFASYYDGLRPLPIDSLLFFWTIACYLRGLHSLLMLLDVYQTYLQKEAIQEIGWTVLCYGAVTYIVGIIYTIPPNYSHGRIDGDNNSDDNIYKSRTIYIPSSRVLNILLCCWCLYPTLTCFPFAISSGIARDNGKDQLADNLTMAQYVAYTIHDLILSAVGIYYGINFILILRQSAKQFKPSTTSSSSTLHLDKSFNANRPYKSNNNVTREALDRLKYTMIYIAVLPLVAAPWWFFYGVYHRKFISSASLSNLFLSSMWHVTGVQPLVAVCQYVLVKNIYQHYKSNRPSNLTSSNSSSSTLSPTSMPSSLSSKQQQLSPPIVPTSPSDTLNDDIEHDLKSNDNHNHHGKHCREDSRFSLEIYENSEKYKATENSDNIV